MRITGIILISFFIFSFSSASAQVVSEIPVQAGEKWWGMFAGNCPEQPLGPFVTVTPHMACSCFCTGYLVSSAGRYIRNDEPMRVVFDDKKFTITSDVEISAEKGGRTLRQAYLAMHHSDFTGTDKFPSPELFSDIVYETEADFGFLQNADDILAYARRLLKEGYPAGIMVLADGWRTPLQNDFDKLRYPDPKAFVDEMHGLGFKVLLTARPYIAAYGAEYALFNEFGVLVADGGKPWTMYTGDGVCSVVDVTNSRTADAIKSGLHEVAGKYGVDGFRMDCIDFIDRYDGSAVDKKTFLRAWHETGAGFAITEFRPGMPEFRTDYVSSVRTAKESQAEYMTDIVTAGIAAGPFVQVLPGFADLGRAGEQETVRYALMQLMMPVAHVPFAPWKYGFAADEMKRVLAFRASLASYMEKAYAEACKTVEPIIRPMEYMFADDGFADCTGQYMLGDKYLIAPALDDSPRRLVRLPKGTWRDMNGKKYKGPMVLEAETDGYKMIWLELQ